MAEWKQQGDVDTKRYRCGYCGQRVSSSRGFVRSTSSAIHICPDCGYPTYIHYTGRQFPGARFGDPVSELPEDVQIVYDEARDCMGVQAFTAAALLCRKILMNVAHHLGADEGLNFIQYVEFLANENYIPPNSHGWVDHIRDKGNEATHEIKPIDKDEARRLMKLTNMLLRIVYEFPDSVPPSEEPDE